MEESEVLTVAEAALYTVALSSWLTSVHACSATPVACQACIVRTVISGPVMFTPNKQIGILCCMCVTLRPDCSLSHSSYIPDYVMSQYVYRYIICAKVVGQLRSPYEPPKRMKTASS